MKTTLKNTLSRLGILPGIDLMRRLPEIAEWLKGGCTGIAPPPVKRMVLAAYMQKYGINQFVETGTHLGDTLAYLAHRKNVTATSIELDATYYLAATKRFSKYTNVTLLQGDSGKLMPELLATLKSPALFWLDGHYSGVGTGKGDLDTPVSAELKAILDSPIKRHVILIDDARCFDATQDYPALETLLEMVRKTSDYHIEVSVDIIRLTPKS